MQGGVVYIILTMGDRKYQCNS